MISDIPTNTGVSLSHSWATAFFKMPKTLRVKKLGLYWRILCRQTKCLNILSLCEPQTLFQDFTWKPDSKKHTDFETLEPEVLTC